MKDSGYFTMTDGTDIYYLRMGAGEPVLFLHGNGGSSRFFKYQVSSFEPYFQLIFLDSRAHGRSTNGGEVLNFRLMAKDTKEALDALGIEKTSIVGFSDGANLAMAFAALYPLCGEQIGIKFRQSLLRRHEIIRPNHLLPAVCRSLRFKCPIRTI